MGNIYNLQINYMKKTTALLLVAILCSTSLFTRAQGTKDACLLISDEQINKIIGCKVKQSGPSILKGARCTHKAADFKSDITLEYYDWHAAKTAQDMIKMNFDLEKKNIAEKHLSGGIFTAFKDFSAGGQNAFIETGAGDLTTNGNVVRMQFLIGSVVFTFDTRGIDMNKVVPNLDKIYAIIKTNYKQ